MEKAIECAGLAVQGEPKEVRYWHLLGLLLSAAEKWQEAMEILDRAAELDLEEEGEEEGEPLSVDDMVDSSTLSQSEDQTLNIPTTNGVIQVTDFAKNGIKANGVGKEDSTDAVTVRPPRLKRASLGTLATGNVSVTNGSPKPSHCVLEPGAADLPAAETLLKSLEIGFEGYPPSRSDIFEWHLQLRMTQVALTEVVEGADGAEGGWLDIFSWVAEKKGSIADGMS